MELSASYIPEDSTQNYFLKLFNVTIEPFKREFIEHKHIFFEIAFFKSAYGVYKTKYNTYDIKPGDIFVFSSNEVHCITEINSYNKIDYINIHFEPKFIWGSEYDSFSPQNAGVCFKHSSSFENRLPRNHPATEKIRQLIIEIENEMQNKKEEYQIVVRANILKIIVTLIRELNYCENDDKQKNSQIKHLETIKAAMNYINQNLDKEISLNEIAKVVGLSPTYFSSLFKKVTTVSLWTYINSKRINLATHLIETNQQSTMLDIAMQCGFNNTANFNKAFKKYTGMTPMDYKKYGNVL